jgi:hypothetical protein
MSQSAKAGNWHNASGVLDALVGGWQLSGLARWTSEFPYSVDGGQRWPTDWFLTAITQMTARPKTGIFHLTIPDPVTGKLDSFVSPFANPTAAQNDFTLPLPGGVGSRNVLRGDGFASWDMSLAKRWKMPYRETHNLQSVQRAEPHALQRTGSRSIPAHFADTITQQLRRLHQPAHPAARHSVRAALRILMAVEPCMFERPPATQPSSGVMKCIDFSSISSFTLTGSQMALNFVSVLGDLAADLAWNCSSILATASTGDVDALEHCFSRLVWWDGTCRETRRAALSLF